MYHLAPKDRNIVDKTFDEMHKTGKMSWTDQPNDSSHQNGQFERAVWWWTSGA